MIEVRITQHVVTDIPDGLWIRCTDHGAGVNVLSATCASEESIAAARTIIQEWCGSRGAALFDRELEAVRPTPRPGVVRWTSSNGIYPPGWPRCVVCGDYAMDGKATCGRISCGRNRQED